MLNKLSSVKVAAAALVAVLAVGGVAGAASQFGCCRWLAGAAGSW